VVRVPPPAEDPVEVLPPPPQPLMASADRVSNRKQIRREKVLMATSVCILINNCARIDTVKIEKMLDKI
jgi:hypothetical protein